MMEKYFGIRYEFDKEKILDEINELVRINKNEYICVADGVSLAMFQRSGQLKIVFEHAFLSVCDSGWVPIFIHWIYKIERKQYTGSDLFYDIILKKKYRMMFLGSSTLILEHLRTNLAIIDNRVLSMPFIELPFCNVEDFDYKSIADQINQEVPDIIWISLGMPKQEIFMYNIKPLINRGVLIGVGAAFKFHSGLKSYKRAPGWMINTKLEWLYRIFSEPKKQIARCSLIIRTIPAAIIKEYKLKREKDVI